LGACPAEAVFQALDNLFFLCYTLLNKKKEVLNPLSTSQFKEITGVSLKYLIPLLEYFDARNVTIRIGEIRKLRGVQPINFFYWQGEKYGRG